MKKRILFLPLILALCLVCLTFSGCDVMDTLRSAGLDTDDADDGVYETVSGMNFSYSPYYTPVVSRYSYQQLDGRQQELYDRLLEGIYTISPQKDPELGIYPMKVVRVSGQMSVAKMRIAIRALTNDNPYIFWLSQSFSHLTDADNNFSEVAAYSEFSPGVLTSLLRQTDAAITAFYGSVPSGLTPYQREKLVHDCVIDNVEYDREIAGLTEISEQNIKGHSIYGALVDRRCVCEGYGMTMQLLLNGLGVDCVTLTGMSYNSSLNTDGADSVLHLWNAVQLDGVWYHVDPTWDDQAEELQRYVFFNLSDEKLSKDHTISESAEEADENRIAENGTEDLNIFIPDCGSMAYNYYVYECPHLTNFHTNDIGDALLLAAQRQDAYFTFYVDPDKLNFDSAVRQLFKDAPQYFFEYVNYANNRLSQYEIDDSNLTYYMNKDRCSISVQLRYY